MKKREDGEASIFSIASFELIIPVRCQCNEPEDSFDVILKKICAEQIHTTIMFNTFRIEVRS